MDKMRSIWTWLSLTDMSVCCVDLVFQTMKVDREVVHDKHGFSCCKSIFYRCMITAY